MYFWEFVKKSILLLFSFFIVFVAKAQTSKDYTVQIQLAVQQSPLRFHLNWDKAATATQYKVFSKTLNALSWTELATLSANDTFYTDSSVKAGEGIEYQVVKFTPNYNGYGYIYASSGLDKYNYRGKLLLLVDDNYKQPLSTEITQLQNDLRGDGWQVITRYIQRTATPPQVKQHITALWQQDSANFKSVYIVGHVAVPYSGYIGPDGHTDHYGAWPADLYYSVVDNSTWTDYVLNTTSANRAANHNTPGDGKFDVDYIVAGSAKLQVGRVDMYDMPAFGMSDTALTRRYLNKAHNFKNNQYNIVLRGLIDDEIGGFGGEAFVRGGWGSFAGMFGDSIIEGGFLPDGTKRSYMFNVSSGFGSYTSSSGIASTGDLVTDSVAIPFTSHFGSYFGDWDNSNNLLKSFIASKSLILTSTWSGRPVYYFHQMALGEPIGHSTLMSANSPRNLYHSVFSSNGVHMALMGDPSLRMHPMSPASNLNLTAHCDRVTLKWTASTDTGISGYRVYRADSLNGEYQWLATVATDSFEDKTATAGHYYYMVRAERLQKTPSGTYFNLSIGITDSVGYYPAPKPVIEVSDTAICWVGQSFKIKNGTASDFPYVTSWRVDGQNVTVNDSLDYTPTQFKDYVVSLAVTSLSGCYDSVVKKVKINQVPAAFVTTMAKGLCIDSNEFTFSSGLVGANYKHIWIFSDNDTLTGASVKKTFSSAGNKTISLTIENTLTGCGTTNSNNAVTIYPKPATPVIIGTSIVRHRVNYSYSATLTPNHTYDWSVSESPDFFQPNNNIMSLRWDNGLLTATIKLVERDTNGCKSDTGYLQIWTVLNSVNGADKEINIYPSPNLSGILTLFNDNVLTGEAEVSISDMKGQQVLQQKLSFEQGENKINISSLETGTYFLIIKQDKFQAAYKFLRVKQW